MCIQEKNQPPWTLTGITEYVEDCLYLDIYTPPNFQAGEKKSVFIWSWGGQLLGMCVCSAGAWANIHERWLILLLIFIIMNVFFRFSLQPPDEVSQGPVQISPKP